MATLPPNGNGIYLDINGPPEQRNFGTWKQAISRTWGKYHPEMVAYARTGREFNQVAPQAPDGAAYGALREIWRLQSAELIKSAEKFKSAKVTAYNDVFEHTSRASISMARTHMNDDEWEQMETTMNLVTLLRVLESVHSMANGDPEQEIVDVDNELHGLRQGHPSISFPNVKETETGTEYITRFDHLAARLTELNGFRADLRTCQAFLLGFTTPKYAHVFEEDHHHRKQRANYSYVRKYVVTSSSVEAQTALRHAEVHRRNVVVAQKVDEHIALRHAEAQAPQNVTVKPFTRRRIPPNEATVLVAQASAFLLPSGEPPCSTCIAKGVPEEKIHHNDAGHDKKKERPSLTCYVCEEPGHKAADCPNKVAMKAAYAQEKSKKGTLMTMIQPSPVLMGLGLDNWDSDEDRGQMLVYSRPEVSLPRDTAASSGSMSATSDFVIVIALWCVVVSLVVACGARTWSHFSRDKTVANFIGTISHEQPMELLGNFPTFPAEMTFYGDTGATEFVTHDASWLTDVHDGPPITLNGSGGLTVLTLRGHFGPLRNIYVHPALGLNLLSIGRLLHMGFQFMGPSPSVSSSTFSLQKGSDIFDFTLQKSGLFKFFQRRNHAPSSGVQDEEATDTSIYQRNLVLSSVHQDEEANGFTVNQPHQALSSVHQDEEANDVNINGLNQTPSSSASLSEEAPGAPVIPLPTVNGGADNKRTFTVHQLQQARKVIDIHRVLGHPSTQRMRQAVANNVFNSGLTGNDVDNWVVLHNCNACVLAKQVRQSSPSTPRAPAENVAELLHIDHLIIGSTDFILAVCDLTHFSMCVRIKSKHKGAVVTGIKKIMAFSAAYGHKVRRFSCDNEAMFVAIREQLGEVNAILVPLATDTKEKMCEIVVKEIKHKMVATALDLEYECPDLFVPCLFEYICQTRNLIGNVNVGNNTTPATLFTGIKLNLFKSVLCFGAIKAFPLPTIGQHPPPLTPRGQIGIVVGRSDDVAGKVRVYLLDTGTFAVRRQYGDLMITESILKLIRGIGRHRPALEIDNQVTRESGVNGTDQVSDGSLEAPDQASPINGADQVSDPNVLCAVIMQPSSAPLQGNLASALWP